MIIKTAFIRVSILLSIAVLPANAHYVTEFWEAKVTDHACFVAARADNTDDDMAAVVSFVAPHPLTPNVFVMLDGFETRPLYTNVQVLPPLSARDSGATITATLEFGGETAELIADPTWDDPGIPVFLLSSATTELIWLHMELGGSIALSVAIDAAPAVQVPIQTTQFSLAMAMHNTCVTEMRKLADN